MIDTDRNVILPVSFIVDVHVPYLIEICEMTLEMNDSSRHTRACAQPSNYTIALCDS
jgi:hypothetical protein